MKIVVYKDGTHKFIESDVTYEYENDKDWLVTIPVELDVEKIKQAIGHSYCGPYCDENLEDREELCKLYCKRLNDVAQAIATLIAEGGVFK